MAKKSGKNSSGIGVVITLVCGIFAIGFGAIGLFVMLVIALISLLVIAFDKKESQKAKTPIFTLQKIDAMDGVEFEKFCVYLVRMLGFVNIYTTPKTGDYGADLVFEKGGRKYVMQCKRYNNNVPNSAVQQVYSSMPIYEAERAIVVTNSHFTQAAKTQAERLGVDLWGREFLEKALANILQYIKEKEAGAKKGFVVTDGQYTFGKDLPAGEYHVKLVSGRGVVAIRHVGEEEDFEIFGTKHRHEITEILSFQGDTGDNIYLSEETTLEFLPVSLSPDPENA